MIRYENDCVGCDACYDCGLKHNKHMYCDECGDEIGLNDEFVDLDFEHLCHDCAIERELPDYLTLENTMAFADQYDDAQINEFLNAALTREQKDEALKACFLTLPKDKQEELLSWYVHYEGAEEFIDFVKEKENGKT